VMDDIQKDLEIDQLKIIKI